MKTQTVVIMRKSKFTESQILGILNETVSYTHGSRDIICVLYKMNQIVQIKPAL